MKKIISLLGVFCLAITAVFAQENVSKPIVQSPVYFDISPPMRDMVKNYPSTGDNSWKDGLVKNILHPSDRNAELDGLQGEDLNVQRWYGDKYITDTTIVNFEANSNTQGFYPPDTYGEVGPNHYFQVVNCHYSIYDKSGVKLLGPISNNAMWNGMTNNSNDGDATVTYDEVANRWMFSQFSLPHYPNGPFFQMIAISQTPDPTGAYYRYQYQYTDMGDYPKFGVWPDGYYMTINRFLSGVLSFKGIGAVAFDRTKMLAGDPTAQSVMFTLTLSQEAWRMLPSDCDGAFPPLGTPCYIGYQANQHIRIYEFHVDWVNTANSTFTNSITLPVNSYNGTLLGIPQKGGSKPLDDFGGTLMYRMQFRKFSDHWSMAACGSINVGSNVSGLRWYELRNIGGAGWSIYQQGTYSPDANSRWMGSIAMDSIGNMAMGYSISSSSMYPSIRYTGRLSSDPLGTMTVGEHGIFNGTSYESYGTLASTLRWGDYSGISVDPSASATFWYTNMYYTSAGTNWKTRIASFSFANIFNVNITATPNVICTSQSSQLNANATGGSGTYTYSWTSLPAGFTSTLQNPVVTPAVTTQYIVAVNDGSATKTDTLTLNVTQEPIANAGTDATYPNISPLFPVTGSATSYSTVKWLTAGDGHFNIDTVLTSLYYPGPIDKNNGGVDLSLRAYSLAPCTDSSTDVVHITLTFPVGIGNNATGAFGVTISPNPSNGNFTLVIHGLKNGEARLLISDLTGKEIYRENGISATNDLIKEISLSGNPKGIYLIKVTTDQQSTTKKLVLQ